MDNNINVYICTHKKYDKILNDDIYKPVLGGACDKNIKVDYILDNTGDNISNKNIYYNEYTVLYWIWKNSNADIVGLFHYRRYFLTGIFGKKLNKDNIIDYLSENDIIVSKSVNFREGSLRRTFYNDKEDNPIYDNISLLEETIRKVQPDYVDAFNKYLDGNTFYSFSMFITNKKLADQYAEFIFSIYEELEKILGADFYKDHPINNYRRAFAGFGEFLFGVWVTGSNLKVKECYVYRVEAISTFLCILDDNLLKKRITYIGRKLLKVSFFNSLILKLRGY